MSSNIQLPVTASRTEPDETPVAPLGIVREVPSPVDRPALSVIVPVRNDPVNLELCLQALCSSDYPDYEVIVVDDASTDNTAEVARRHGVRRIRLETRSGPAAARNLGARAARHSYLFFLDADVCVQPGTLGQVAEKFLSDPAVDAFFGSYDARPGASNLLSQYRNLLHHYVHQAGNADAFSFWSGCGAIKRAVFLAQGGFDTSYANASIEDIELGSRLRRSGHRIELVKSIQVKHMKRWTLWRMIHTDIRNRGIPWTLLLLRQGRIPNDLNLRHSQRLSALLAAGLPAAAALTAHSPGDIQLWVLVALGCVLGIVLLNLRFYLFLARAKTAFFALLAMPLHVLYYLYSGLAFAAGLLLHLGRGRNQPRPGPS